MHFISRLFVLLHLLPLSHLLPKLIHKPLMEVRDLPHPLRSGSQERGPEMQRAWPLSESRAWDHADARCVQ